MSRLVTAKVHGGVLVGEDFARLPDGTTVEVVVPDDEPVSLSAEVKAELVDRLAEADRGDAFVSAAEVLRKLAARRAAPVR